MNSKNSLKNKKIAIITGSEGEIGKALIKKFEANNFKVYGFDIKKGIDITNYGDIEAKVSSIGEKHKRIDVLVNNAGITIPGYGIEGWNKTFEVNLKAPFYLSQLVVPYMRVFGGSIINITSIRAEVSGANNPAYGASKGGLKVLTKCLAHDFAKYNIRVNNVGFGYIKTDMTTRSWNDIKRRKEIENATMLNRWGNSIDVVGVIYFLTTEEAKYITAGDYMVDGGVLNKGV